MTKRVVAITGIGTLTPAGRGTQALWERVTSGDTCLTPIDPQKYFDASKYTCQVAGQVPSFAEPRVLTDAMLAQTDRCSQMALVAVLDALDAANLPIDFRSSASPVSAERVSLTVATSAAGWTYVEHEMRNLWTRGVEAMDRYGLTAGFPAGPQGHISIFFGVEGRTRTFVSERASGAHALIEGAKAIQRGDADVAIVGGTEAPLTPLAWAAYDASGMLYPTHTTSNSKQHPGHQRSNMLVGEGSTFLILEEREHARRRNVPVLAEISGWHKGTNPTPLGGTNKEPGRGFIRSIHASLAQADLQPDAIDAIFPAGPGLAEEDLAEELAVKHLELPIPLATSKTILGHLQGAAVTTDIAIAALTFQHAASSPLQTALFKSTTQSSSERGEQIKHALLLSSGLGGMYASLLVSKSE